MSTGIGEALRERRHTAGVELTDAAAETRIRETHLRALEDEDFSRIGGDVYVKGFIRSYARYLGVDPEPLVRTYQDSCEDEEEEAWIGHSEPIEAPPAPRRPITTIVVVLALLMLGGLALIGLFLPEEEEPRTEVAVPDPVDDPDPSEGQAGASAAPGDAEPSDPDPNGSSGIEGGEANGEGSESDDAFPGLNEEIVLTVSIVEGSSWTRIVVDGEAVQEATLQPGYTETYRGDDIVVRVGNAGAVSLEVNGDDLGEIGSSGSVVNVQCNTAAAECVIG